MTAQMDRRDWMGLIAKVPSAWLDEVWEQVGAEPALSVIRTPEIGSVMVRGRAGATGAPFNLGEMTVTRCTVQVEGGPVGHGYVQGRDREKARRAAVLDAMLQGPRGDELQGSVLAPLALRLAQVRQGRAAKAAATKVEFFTLVRGED